MQVVRIDDRGELIASLPVMMGFCPTHTVAIIGYRESGQVGFSPSVPLDSTVPPAAVVAAQIVPMLKRNTIVAATMIVVADHDDATAQALLDALRLALESADIEVVEALWVPEISEGATWHDVRDPARSGTLPDRHTTQLAAASVVEGMRTYDSRDQLESELAPAPTADLERRAELVAPLLRAVRLDVARDARAAIDRHVDLLRNATMAARSGDLPTSDADIVALAAVLTNPVARDYSLSLDEPAAADLWKHLTRVAPRPEAAEAAVLFACAAYRRGDSTLAKIAVHHALDIVPDHTLASLLQQIFALGTSPKEFNELLQQVVADVEAEGLQQGDTATQDDAH